MMEQTSNRYPVRRGWLAPILWLAVVAWTVVGAPARASIPPVEARLQVELERIYSLWKTAFSTKDLSSWARYTARSRQMAVRNAIVSQKRDWPRALFTLALAPPETTGLRLAGSQAIGDQARLIYYGRVDFRLDDPRTPPENALVLDFAREQGQWKFYGGRYFNFTNDPSLGAQVAQGNFTVLSGPGAELTGHAPPVPKPCPVPAFPGQIRINSIGYHTKIRLGDWHQDTVANRTSNEIVLGGLQKGTTPLRLEVQPIEGVPTDQRSLEVQVYAITEQLKTPAVRVFHFQPNNPVGPTHDLTVSVTPATLRTGNEIDLIPAQ